MNFARGRGAIKLLRHRSKQEAKVLQKLSSIGNPSKIYFFFYCMGLKTLILNPPGKKFITMIFLKIASCNYNGYSGVQDLIF